MKMKLIYILTNVSYKNLFRYGKFIEKNSKILSLNL